MEETYGEGNVTVTKDENTYIVEIDGEKYQIDENGKVALYSGTTPPVEPNVEISYIGDMEEQTVARNETITLTLPNDLDQSISGEQIWWGGYNVGDFEVASDGRSANYTPNQKGDCNIDVEINGIRYTTFPVHVVVPIESISFNQENYSFKVNEGMCNFTFSVEPNDADLVNLWWECEWGNSHSNPINGEISPQYDWYPGLYVDASSTEGNFKISIYNEETRTLYDEAEVQFEWAEYTSFSLDCDENIELAVGESLNVDITYEPGYADTEGLWFDSSDSSVSVTGSGSSFTIYAEQFTGNTAIITITNHNIPSWER